jgi:hypothetical protein
MHVHHLATSMYMQYHACIRTSYFILDLVRVLGGIPTPRVYNYVVSNSTLAHTVYEVT